MCLKWKSDKQNCIYCIKFLGCETKRLVLKTEVIVFFSNIILFLLSPANCSSKSKAMFNALPMYTLKVDRRESKYTLTFLHVPDLSGKCCLKHISYLNMFVLTNYILGQGTGQVSSSCNSMHIIPACPLPLPWKKVLEKVLYLFVKREIAYAPALFFGRGILLGFICCC